MKSFAPTICLFTLLAGCQVMPDTTDTTPPLLTFSVHYQGTSLNSPAVEIRTHTSTEARRCLYVNSPFLVVARAEDSGGIRSIIAGPSAYFDGGLVPGSDPQDVLSLPVPAERTVTYPDGTYPNPGKRGSTAHVLFSTAKAYAGVSLFVNYEFTSGITRGALRATTRNFGPAAVPAEVYHFYLQRATDDPWKQPGMECPIPDFS
jgi:hypothetical protein